MRPAKLAQAAAYWRARDRAHVAERIEADFVRFGLARDAERLWLW